MKKFLLLSTILAGSAFAQQAPKADHELLQLEIAEGKARLALIIKQAKLQGVQVAAQQAALQKQIDDLQKQLDAK